MAGRIASFFDLVFWLVTTTKKTEVEKDGTKKTVERIVHAIRTGSPGFYAGDYLEQGKGHTALPLWLDAGVYSPGRILDEISKAAPGCSAVDSGSAVEPAGDLPTDDETPEPAPGPAADEKKAPDAEPAKASSKKGGKSSGATK